MENITSIKNIFKEALEQTISNYAEKARLDVSQMILHICAEVRPYMLVTDAGAETLADEIFTNDLRRDFIFNLLFNFCPRLSFTNVENEFKKIIDTLSFTLAIKDKVGTVVDEQYRVMINKIPDELTMRLSAKKDISALLEHNKWLVMVLMINLFISIDDFPTVSDVSKT